MRRPKVQEVLDLVAICVARELDHSPRSHVDFMTRSSFEIGRTLKKHLRDVLYERRRADSRKAASVTAAGAAPRFREQ
jgi:hypothetical protein